MSIKNASSPFVTTPFILAIGRVVRPSFGIQNFSSPSSLQLGHTPISTVTCIQGLSKVVLKLVDVLLQQTTVFLATKSRYSGSAVAFTVTPPPKRCDSVRSPLTGILPIPAPRRARTKPTKIYCPRSTVRRSTQRTDARTPARHTDG